MQGVNQPPRDAALWARLAELTQLVKRLRGDVAYQRRRADLWRHRAQQQGALTGRAGRRKR